MNYEELKKEFIKLKKEELNYIDNIIKQSTSRVLSEVEKIEIYRTLNNYKKELNEMLKQLREKILQNGEISIKNRYDVIIEFDIAKNYLSNIDEYLKDELFFRLGIDHEKFKYVLKVSEIIRGRYVGINCNSILINQSLYNNPIYVFEGYYDSSEDCYGPFFGNPDDYLYAIYKDIRYEYTSTTEKVLKSKMNDFEKSKVIICSENYVSFHDIKQIFEEELLNDNNDSINACIVATKNRIEELSYVRSPEYKEKILLDKINELYKKVKGEYIQKEILYSGSFLEVIKETYKLPNEKMVSKEKIVKNGGKNSVIIISVTEEKEYIITFQNRIKNEIIAEFPSGYVEKGEDPIETAKRELMEETGYTSDNLVIVDEVYTSPGIDNSITYIVVADNCVKTDEIKNDCTELVKYGLFSKKELDYLVNHNMMKGAMNKLAYYDIQDCNKKHYKKQIYYKF